MYCSCACAVGSGGGHWVRVICWSFYCFFGLFYVDFSTRGVVGGVWSVLVV